MEFYALGGFDAAHTWLHFRRAHTLPFHPYASPRWHAVTHGAHSHTNCTRTSTTRPPPKKKVGEREREKRIFPWPAIRVTSVRRRIMLAAGKRVIRTKVTTVTSASRTVATMDRASRRREFHRGKIIASPASSVTTEFIKPSLPRLEGGGGGQGEASFPSPRWEFN